MYAWRSSSSSRQTSSITYNNIIGTARGFAASWPDNLGRPSCVSSIRAQCVTRDSIRTASSWNEIDAWFSVHVFIAQHNRSSQVVHFSVYITSWVLSPLKATPPHPTPPRPKYFDTFYSQLTGTLVHSLVYIAPRLPRSRPCLCYIVFSISLAKPRW